MWSSCDLAWSAARAETKAEGYFAGLGTKNILPRRHPAKRFGHMMGRQLFRSNRQQRPNHMARPSWSGLSGWGLLSEQCMAVWRRPLLFGFRNRENEGG